ncbi:hypothetical protein TRFO_09893 [Tritrichomonas foetus]|uniref:BAR domain-containing protein n=1 Tax=Tritrichomonas foetus TaxID=1144522 RepID=A0A1J4JDZ9_9EUKA|nr:hypothetical protein TRFO_09893 [Tritrichomonas foetus]|eukprot:OHS96511.1 hypothetical protein TRFO_09893 [Tritrichomonas foetus]
MFSTLRQPKELKEIYQFVNHAKYFIDQLKERSKATAAFANDLMALIQQEAPNFALHFGILKQLYLDLSASYLVAYFDQIRVFEDMNDIVARVSVIKRLEQEGTKAFNSYQIANKKYQEIKSKYKSAQSQENQILFDKARIERAKAAEELLNKHNEIKEYQPRFDKFVQNRTSSAWARFALSMEKLSKEEASIMEEISSFCKAIRDNLDNPEILLSKVRQYNESLTANQGPNTFTKSDDKGEVDQISTQKVDQNEKIVANVDKSEPNKRKKSHTKQTSKNTEQHKPKTNFQIEIEVDESMLSPPVSGSYSSDNENDDYDPDDVPNIDINNIDDSFLKDIVSK